MDSIMSEGAAPNISADGLTLYFASNRPRGEGGFDLWQATRPTVDDPFGDVMNLGPGVNGPVGDAKPAIAFDSLTLYFNSSRPGGSGGRDIWQATRLTVDDPFDDAMNLGPGINSAFDERAGHISDDGLTLYFESTRPDGEGELDLYMATRENRDDPFANVTNLGSGINWPSRDIAGGVSSNQLVTFFSDGSVVRPVRPGGRGEADIWVAVRTTTAEQFGDVVNLNDFSLGSNVNGPFNEGQPSISHDWPAPGSQLFFTAEIPTGGNKGLWQATWVPEPSGLAGDYNGDGTVNAADYVVWRDNLGAPAGTLPNDTDGGGIGQDQYDTWKANFGNTAGRGALSDTAVPEPASAWLVIMASAAVCLRCRQRAIL